MQACRICARRSGDLAGATWVSDPSEAGPLCSDCATRLDEELVLPPDPFPDLTLHTIAGFAVRDPWGRVLQLVPGEVVMGEVIERALDGHPVRLRVLR